MWVCFSYFFIIKKICFIELSRIHSKTLITLDEVEILFQNHFPKQDPAEMKITNWFFQSFFPSNGIFIPTVPGHDIFQFFIPIRIPRFLNFQFRSRWGNRIGISIGIDPRNIFSLKMNVSAKMVCQRTRELMQKSRT